MNIKSAALLFCLFLLTACASSKVNEIDKDSQKVNQKHLNAKSKPSAHSESPNIYKSLKTISTDAEGSPQSDVHGWRGDQYKLATIDKPSPLAGPNDIHNSLTIRTVDGITESIFSKSTRR